MRFINADDPNIIQMGSAEKQELNLYAYCVNDPVNGVDPTGLFSIPTWVISVPIDAAILWIAGHFHITWMGYMAPLKIMGKNAAARLFSKTVAPVLKGLVGTIMKIITKALTWIGKKAYAASINFTAKLAISAIISEPLRAITAIMSVGGLIAAIWDYVSDRKFDGRIRI